MSKNYCQNSVNYFCELLPEVISTILCDNWNYVLFISKAINSKANALFIGHASTTYLLLLLNVCCPFSC